MEPAHVQTQSATWSLHGREGQVRHIEQLMRATAEGHRGHVVLLGSNAGSGKTRLLLEAISLAAQRGFSVLDGVPNSPTPISSRHGRQDGDWINWLDGYLRRGPVLVVLADAQWMDPAVLRALGALMAKLDDAPVLWLFALCTEHAESANGLLLRTLAWGTAAFGSVRSNRCPVMLSSTSSATCSARFRTKTC
jgi:hypothetical protein